MSDDPYQGSFAAGRHRFALRVYFEDTDATGIVYHASYLRFMERARSDMLRCLAIHQQAMIAAGAGFYSVYDLSITFKAPARLDDALIVVSSVAAVRAAATVLHQQVWRGQQLLSDARVTAAWVGAGGRPRRQPKDWDTRFRALLAETRDN